MLSIHCRFSRHSFCSSRDIDCTEQWWHCYSLAVGLIIRTLLHHLLEFVNRQETFQVNKLSNKMISFTDLWVRLKCLTSWLWPTACGPSLTMPSLNDERHSSLWEQEVAGLSPVTINRGMTPHCSCRLYVAVDKNVCWRPGLYPVFMFSRGKHFYHCFASLCAYPQWYRVTQPSSNTACSKQAGQELKIEFFVLLHCPPEVFRWRTFRWEIPSERGW